MPGVAPGDGHGPGCFTHLKGVQISKLQLYLWEALMTFVLVSVVYATAVTKPGHGSMAPLAIGFTLYASAAVGSLYSTHTIMCLKSIFEWKNLCSMHSSARSLMQFCRWFNFVDEIVYQVRIYIECFKKTDNDCAMRCCKAFFLHLLCWRPPSLGPVNTLNTGLCCPSQRRCLQPSQLRCVVKITLHGQEPDCKSVS